MKKLKLPKIKIWMVFAALIAAAVFAYVFFTAGAAASAAAVFTETDFILPYNFEDKADAHSFGGRGFFLSTKDGMTYYSSSGEIRWTDIYPISLSDPVMTGGGAYAGVCDAGGSVLYVYSSDGLMYQKSYGEAILSFYVSPGGFVSVIRKDGNDYAISAYNARGDEINCYFSRDAGTFPIASAISRDGRVLMIAVVNINAAVMESKIMLLYNASDEKQAFLNGIFYQETLVNELAGRADFLPDGSLVYLTDKSAACIQTAAGGGKTPGELWRIGLTNEARAFGVSGGGLTALVLGAPRPGEAGFAPGTVHIYDGAMKMINEYVFPGHTETDKTGLVICGDYIIASSANSYAAFDKRGRLIWEHTAAGDVRKLLIVEDQNTALQMENLQARVLKRR